MDKNTDERVVVIDRAQFDELRHMASMGSSEDGCDEEFNRILRHVHKFNPSVPTDDEDEKAKELDRRRTMVKQARRWQKRYASTAYLRGYLNRYGLRQQPYLFPVTIIGRAHDAMDGSIVTVLVEFQVHDDDQREAFLFLLRTCRTSRDSQYPRFDYQLFNGHPVAGGQGVVVAGRWSHRQHRRLLKGSVPKLYIAVDVTDLVESVPNGYQPCSGLFQGMYFLPT